MFLVYKHPRSLTWVVVADFSAAVGRAGRLVPRPSCRTVDAGTPKYRNFTGAYNELCPVHSNCLCRLQLAEYRSRYDARSCVYCVHNMPALQSWRFVPIGSLGRLWDVETGCSGGPSDFGDKNCKDVRADSHVGRNALTILGYRQPHGQRLLKLAPLNAFERAGFRKHVNSDDVELRF